MGAITDRDVTGRVASKSGSILGAAHEHLVTGLLMRLGFDVSVSSVTTATYDLLIEAYTSGPESPRKLIKAQVKTCQGSLSLIGGGRGGVDRITLSGVKTYKYSEEHCDLMIGVQRDSLDLYLFPMRYGQLYRTSVALSKIRALRNNWDVLLHWNLSYLQELERQVLT